MKPYLLTLIATIILAACSAKNATEQTTATADGLETYSFKDSTEHVICDISVTVPIGNNNSQTIRDTLLNIVDRQMAYIGIGDGTRLFAPYKGTERDLKSIMEYESTAAFKALSDQAEADFKERSQYLSEDTTITDAQRTQMLQDTPRWLYSMTLKKVSQDSIKVVYDLEDDCYMGGAHPNHGGAGALTFRLSDGKYVSQFFKADAVKGMQPLLIKGLKQYFTECGEKIASDKDLFDLLQIEGKVIPLPVRAPEITPPGLLMTYGQYEIACYAAGMPAFNIPFSELTPFLTDNAASLFR